MNSAGDFLIKKFNFNRIGIFWADRSCLMRVLAGAGFLILGQFYPAESLHAQELTRPLEVGQVIGRGIHLIEDHGTDTAALVVDLSDEVTFRSEVLATPNRLVIDLDKVVFAGSGARSGTRPVGPVAGFRAGLFVQGRSRIILDLARPALVDRADFVRQGGVARLVIQIRGTNEARFLEIAQADAAKRLALRMPTPVSAAPVAGALPLIVLDPGHGGIDPGASGAKGQAEKDVVLAVALSTRDRLNALGKVRVMMTREDDRFVPLGERVAIARTQGAALFVSLHADVIAGEPDVRGASVYTLSDRASDAAAERAAEKENRADLVAGLDPDEEARGGIDTILFDLARRETRAFSLLAARDAAGAIRSAASLHKTPMRSARFRVLRAPDVPSILIELGYLSNVEDIAILTDSAAQKRIADQLGEALQRFVLTGQGKEMPAPNENPSPARTKLP